MLTVEEVTKKYRAAYRRMYPHEPLRLIVSGRWITIEAKGRNSGPHPLDRLSQWADNLNRRADEREQQREAS